MKKIAFTAKSVRDNPQRAILDPERETITVQNKSGRKIVARKTFSIYKWEAASKKYGNPHSSMREFVVSLNLCKKDGTPEDDCLVERIIDAQVNAIEEVYKRRNENG
jgi:hypothetical protein